MGSWVPRVLSTFSTVFVCLHFEILKYRVFMLNQLSHLMLRVFMSEHVNDCKCASVGAADLASVLLLNICGPKNHEDLVYLLLFWTLCACTFTYILSFFCLLCFLFLSYTFLFKSAIVKVSMVEVQLKIEFLGVCVCSVDEQAQRQDDQVLPTWKKSSTNRPFHSNLPDNLVLLRLSMYRRATRLLKVTLSTGSGVNVYSQRN